MNTDNTQTTSSEESPLPGWDNPSQITGSAAPADIAGQDALLSCLQYPPSDKTQWLFACETHKYVREFISSADYKAQWYIAFASAFLAWLNTSIFPDFWSKNLKEWQLIDTLSVISVIGLSICIFSY